MHVLFKTIVRTESNMNMNGAERRAYDEDINDQPVDYSKKYIERNALSQSRRLANGSRTNHSAKKEFREHDTKVDPFGDYAETDLDQPTDYSLRYAEDDTDDEEKQSTEYFPGSMQEDTIKTYYTEGTPYETPFNFSTATSMLDLRVDETKEINPLKKITKKLIEIAHKSTVSFIKQAVAHICEEQESLTKELGESSKLKILNSGQVTPEKIVSYYEEEDHVLQGFSRANSFSSLNSGTNNQNEIPQVISKVDLPNSVNKKKSERTDDNVLGLSSNEMILENTNLSENKNSPNVVDKEGKMVTFGGEDYYAEQTPLMFSRCSSLGSLSGFEQHSIHDDRSSIVSDFSRRTSGVVSPSELPDSPTQTVAPNLRNHKSQNMEFISKIQEETMRPSIVRHLVYPKTEIGRNSVFEDEIATFKEESTPIEFSTATSLSSLTIDDEAKLSHSIKVYSKLEKIFDVENKDVRRIETDMLNMTLSNSGNKTKEEESSDIDEDDEKMLAQCIDMGMKNNRYRQSHQMLNSQKPMHSKPVLTTYQKNTVLDILESHVSEAAIKAPIVTSKVSKTPVEIAAAQDTVHVYCTEDTPAVISPVGSHSNLSALSMQSIEEDTEQNEQNKSTNIKSHINDSSDESTTLSHEDEKLLDECIQSAMYKITRLSRMDSIPWHAKKSEMLPQRFHKCGTPSSSPVEINHINKNPLLAKTADNTSLRQVAEFSDDSSNHSEDEALLTECIQSAMAKVGFNLSSSIRRPLPQIREKPIEMNMRMSSNPPALYQSRDMEPRKNVTKKVSPIDDNTGLTEEEEDRMLAQCIRSGMPKVLRSISATVAATYKKSELYSKTAGNFPVSSSSYYANKAYDVRNDHSHASSSYKPMNMNSAELSRSRNPPTNFNCLPEKVTNNVAHSSNQTLRHYDHNTREKMSNSSYYARRLPHIESKNANSVNNLGTPSRSGMVKYDAPILNRRGNSNIDSSRNSRSNAVPSRHNSGNSFSENNSHISPDEWALLEMCINSGIPKNKRRVKGIKSNEQRAISRHNDRERITEDNYSSRTYNSYISKR